MGVVSDIEERILHLDDKELATVYDYIKDEIEIRELQRKSRGMEKEHGLIT